jgi:type IV pilus assembly protein PilB
MAESRVTSAVATPRLTAEERRELAATASVFELIVEANPADVGALENLIEIYTRLGDDAQLTGATSRIKAVVPSWTPPASPPAVPVSAPAGGAPLRLESAAAAARRESIAAAGVAAPPREPTVIRRETVTGGNGAPVPPRVEVAASREAAPVAPPRPAAPSVSAPAPKPPAAPEPAEPSAPTPVPQRQVRRASLADFLVSSGYINRPQLEQALREGRRSKEQLGTALVRLGFIAEDQLASILSEQYGIPAVSIPELTIGPDVVALVPLEVARKHDLLPIRREGSVLTVAMANPVNIPAIDEVALLSGLQVTAVVAAQGAIRRGIDHHYETTAGLTDALGTLNDLPDVEVLEDDEFGAKVDVFELKDAADEAPVVRLVNKVLVDAIARGASDIHWEPYEKIFRIRFRVDGVLHEVVAPPKRLEPAMISRLKIMASLDIAERRVPQDGRIKLRYLNREIDFRVSVLPTIFGEKAVLRILDKDSLKLDLTALGFDAWSLEQFQTAIRQPYGMILITGPTGSGKTTTLYSGIHTINSPDVNIMTVEDPVEYNLKGVNQVQVNEAVGRTFATALRSFLRQDPDVILVGETRDLETAQISIRAALTGHLVFSTLHTNDCPSTIARLVDMGIPPFLVSSSLLLLLAQRLGRKLCQACREPYEADEDSLVPYGHVPTGRGRCTFYKSRGCTACNHTGMKGRVAIYEVMPVSEHLKDLILKNASTAELREVAREGGMRTLRESGLLKVIEGITTVEEVLRVTLG